MPEITDRIIAVRNQVSTHADSVEQEVMAPLREAGLRSGQLLEFVIDSTIDRNQNVEKLAESIRPGDRVLSLGGDGTGNSVINARIISEAAGVRIGFLPYGRFNDMGATFTSRDARRNPLALLTSDDVVRARPLRVTVDGEHLRYALLYATLGWSAQVAADFDAPEARATSRTDRTEFMSTLSRLARSYFGERATAALPTFHRDNDDTAHAGLTDVLAINGPIMGAVIRSGTDYFAGETFLSSELDVSTIWRNIPFLGRTACNTCFGTHLALPGTETDSVKITFDERVSVVFQMDGEHERLAVRELGVDKSSHRADDTLPSVDVVAASQPLEVANHYARASRPIL